MLTVSDIIAKRKERWQQYGDIEYDRKLVEASVRKVLTEPHLRDEIMSRPYLLIELAFDIVDKHQDTVPFFMNEVQRDFIDQFEKQGTGRPYVILKGRQQGFTSLITAIQLSYAITQKNFSGFTLADCSQNTRTIFNDKARMVYSRLPSVLKPTERFNSANELFFDRLNSSWRVATATEQVARSKTLNFVHLSEAAFYKCTLSDLQKSIGEAMTKDAFCVYESTANGFNEFRDLWRSGACITLFYGWWRTSEYRSRRYELLNTDDKWLIDRIQVLRNMGLDREQIAWYCEKYESYLDKRSICQEYPCSPDEAFISSGDCIFDKEAINNRIIAAQALPPPRVGWFEYKKTAVPIKNKSGEIEDVEYTISDIQFVERRDGYIRIHEEPQERRDREGYITARAPYVIGGDTADMGEDYFTAKVIFNPDGHTVATLQKQRMDEELYAEQLYCLGMYYNTALIGVETNYSRHPMRVLWNKYRYPSLYMRERVDRMTDEREHVYGFETTTKTKNIILSELVTIMRENPDIECDIPTLQEMTTFVKKDNGKQEAQTGQHDDLVMALAIAHFISKQQTTAWISESEDDDELFGSFHVNGNSGGQYMNWGY